MVAHRHIHLSSDPGKNTSITATTLSHPVFLISVTSQRRKGDNRKGDSREGFLPPKPSSVDPIESVSHLKPDPLDSSFTKVLSASAIITFSETSSIVTSDQTSSNNQDDIKTTSSSQGATSLSGTLHGTSPMEPNAGPTPTIPPHVATSTLSLEGITDSTLSDITATTPNDPAKDSLASSSPNHTLLAMGILGGVLGSLLVLATIFFCVYFWRRYKRRAQGQDIASAERQATGQVEDPFQHTPSCLCVNNSEYKRQQNTNAELSSSASLGEPHEDELMVARRSLAFSLPCSTTIHDEQTHHLYVSVQRNASVRSTRASLGSASAQSVPLSDLGSIAATTGHGNYSTQRPGLIRIGPTTLRDSPLPELSEVDSDSLRSIAAPPSYEE